MSPPLTLASQGTAMTPLTLSLLPAPCPLPPPLTLASHDNDTIDFVPAHCPRRSRWPAMNAIPLTPCLLAPSSTLASQGNLALSLSHDTLPSLLCCRYPSWQFSCAIFEAMSFIRARQRHFFGRVKRILTSLFCSLHLLSQVPRSTTLPASSTGRNTSQRSSVGSIYE